MGFLGIDDSIPAGELSLRLVFRVGAENATPERLRELVKWVEAHSPVGDSVSRAIPTKVEIEVVRSYQREKAWPYLNRGVIQRTLSVDFYNAISHNQKDASSILGVVTGD
jgi:hypothetical protein